MVVADRNPYLPAVEVQVVILVLAEVAKLAVIIMVLGRVLVAVAVEDKVAEMATQEIMVATPLGAEVE